MNAKSGSARGRATARKGKRRTRRKKSGSEQLLKALLSGSLWGIVLVILGLFSALALLSANRGSLTGWWIEQLSLLFGIGVYWLPVVLIVLGIFLYLRSSGHAGAFTLPRLIGFFLLWVAVQGAAHLMGVATGTEIDPGSPAGDYGGMMGWFISQSLVTVVGTSLTMVALLLLAFFGIVLLLGMSLDDLAAAINSAAATAAAFLASLPRRWRDRRSGVIRVRPSRWERFKLWLAARRRARVTVDTPVDHPNSPVSSLPSDPIPAPPAEPVAPTMRIIGGEQTIWRLPRVEDILDDFGNTDLTEEDLAERAHIIEDTLGSFGVPVTVVEVNKGPVVTQFGLRPGYITRKVRGEEKRMKVRVSKIQALSNDLSLALAASPIRIEAPVPGRNIVGLEVPNASVAMVSLRSILESEEFKRLKAPLRVCLGQDVSGSPVAASLARMPHLLIAGATGSGKSVCVNAVICSLLFRYTPDELRFVMVDPKRVELTGYNGIPHLVDSVVTEIEKVVGVLHWATTEMDRRYKDLEKAGARNVDTYNAKRQAEGKAILPYIVIIIDELADIMMMAPDDVERSLVRIAQMARATGIHLVIATQRPSVNVVTGLIKANFPSRVAFAVTSQIDSRVILDIPGAERLLGSGDMLFMRPDSAKLARLQGAFVSDVEVNRLARYWRGQRGGERQADVRPLRGDIVSSIPQADLPETQPTEQRPLWDDMMAQAEVEAKKDALFDQAVVIVQESGKASVSLLQRRLRIGYSRAARLIDMLEEEGIVGPDQGGSRGREVLIDSPEEADALEPTDEFETF